MQLTLSNGQTVDPTTLTNQQPDSSVIGLQKVIKNLEGGDYTNRSGDGGSSAGAYQWNNDNKPLRPGELPSHWKNAAAQYLKDSNAPMTQDNQDFVAYQQLKAYKDQGRSPEEIDALWNGAKKDPATGNYVHVSQDRANKFKQAVLGNQPSQGFNPTPFSNPTEQTKGNNPGAIDVSGINNQTDTKNSTDTSSLGGELSNRISQASQGITSLVQGQPSGQNRLSGAIQTVGAVGGAIGDITGAVLEKIPGVKSLENVIGNKTSQLAQTPSGQAIIKSLQDFQTVHPELSKDIGAGFNILTAIPILRGLGTIKNIVLDGTSQALKNAAEKKVTQDLITTANRTVTGRKAISRGGTNEVKTLIDERAIPEIANGKYSTQEASHLLDERISSIEDNELQPLLESAKSKTGIQTSYVSLNQLEKESIKMAIDELKDPAPIKTYFERLRAKYGETPTIQEVNKAKRLVSKNITDAGFQSPTYSTDKIVRSSLQKGVEDGAKALGLPDVEEINQKMARLIKAQKMLSNIEGKPVQVGKIGGLMKGLTEGIPVIGPVTEKVAKNMAKGTIGILQRTGKGATRVPIKTGVKNIGGLLGASLLNKQNQ